MLGLVVPVFWLAASVRGTSGVSGLAKEGFEPRILSFLVSDFSGFIDFALPG